MCSFCGLAVCVCMSVCVVCNNPCTQFAPASLPLRHPTIEYKECCEKLIKIQYICFAFTKAHANTNTKQTLFINNTEHSCKMSLVILSLRFVKFYTYKIALSHYITGSMQPLYCTKLNTCTYWAITIQEVGYCVVLYKYACDGATDDRIRAVKYHVKINVMKFIRV